MGDLEVFSVFASLGAGLAMHGAFVQLGLELGDRLSYMRRVRDLDEQGVDAAKERTILLAYKYPEELGWIPSETFLWLRRGSPDMVGWVCVGFGAYFLFIASLAPVFKQPEQIVWGVLLSIAVFVIVIVVSGVITANNDRPGRERAEAEWLDANPGKVPPKDTERPVAEWLEKWNNKIFGY